MNPHQPHQLPLQELDYRLLFGLVWSAMPMPSWPVTMGCCRVFLTRRQCCRR